MGIKDKLLSKVLGTLVVFLVMLQIAHAQDLIQKIDFTNNTINAGLSNHSITDIAKDSLGFIWIATSDGLFRFESKDELKDFKEGGGIKLKSRNIRSLFVDSKNNLWIGTRLGGISCYNPLDKSTKTYLHDESDPRTISNNTILSITEDSKGRIWVGTEIGLNLFNPEDENFISWISDIDKSTSIHNTAVFTIEEDDRGFIWLGTSAGGLTLVLNSDGDNLSNISFRHFPLHKDIDSSKVCSLTEDDKKRLWIGTLADGLFMTKVPEHASNNAKDQNWALDYIKITKANTSGIGSNSINDVLIDSENNLWLGTSDGVYLLISEQIDKEIDHKTKFNFLNYKNELYNSKSPSQEIINKIFEDKDGIFWLGANSWFSWFRIHKRQIKNFDQSPIEEDSKLDSSRVYQHQKTKTTYITEATIINKDHEKKINLIGEKEITLAPNNYYLSLRFVDIDYKHMNETKYAYKLEGFDEKWFYPKKNVSAVYTNLRPGKYTFKIKTAIKEGAWSEEITELKIIKEHTLIQSPWMKFFLYILSLLILFIVISLYTSGITKNNQKLQTLNDNLNKEISERKKIEQDLVQTNKDLQQFAYSASHDLQEPLRNIGNAVGLLKRKNLLDEKSDEYVEIAVDGVKRMSSLIENILNYSRSGTKSIVIEIADLNKIVNEKITDLTQLIASKNAKLIIEDLPNIPCEVNQIGIVFYNLINNAIKFNKNKNPIIKVGYKELENHWLFYVEDNGIGISKKYQHSIFSVFTRLESKRGYEGTGIGLSLCQKIVLRHSGEIWLKSKENEGSTFYFTIQKNLRAKAN